MYPPVSVAHHRDEEVDQQNCHNHDEHQEFHLNTLQIVPEYDDHIRMAEVKKFPSWNCDCDGDIKAGHLADDMKWGPAERKQPVELDEVAQ